MEKELAQPMTRTLVLVMGLVLLLGMSAYGSIQYFLNPTSSVFGIVLEHLPHVLFLIVLMYAALFVVIHRKVVAPIQALRKKLHLITTGDLSPVTVDSRVAEIEAIQREVNLMIEKIVRTTPEVSLAELTEGAMLLRDLARRPGTLRALARDGADLEHSTREMLMDTAGRIDDTVAVITTNLLDQNQEPRATSDMDRMVPAGGKEDR
jgi:hypothetical protein